MKKTLSLILATLMILVCAFPLYAAKDAAETVITLSDGGVRVGGSAASANPASAVYVGADIVYYEAGHDSTYGEGTKDDEHTAEEAKAHTVVTITQAGTYRVTGTLSAGQIAIDLGADAASDPAAVVTLILDNADITCTVAPAVIFYNVYECGEVDTATASATVDTSKAGANVIIADGSENHINGAYVARIYKTGTTKKLHKYDGAFYSKMSMNVSGGEIGDGVLNITAENEGLDSEVHLTIHSGVININAQNDGINTNEDGVSVTTINGGTLHVNGGFGVEGDGIDSNGYLVINGGTVIATANPIAGDGGIDADMDILLNGGTVIALGRRNDATGSNSKQAYMELSYASTQKAGTTIRLEDTNGQEIIAFTATRDYQSVTISTPSLSLDTTYHLYSNDMQQQYTGTGSMGRWGGGMMPGGGQIPGGMMPGGGQLPDGVQLPEGNNFPEGTGRTAPFGRMTELPEGWTQRPEGTREQDGTQQSDGTQRPEGTQSPDGTQRIERPDRVGAPLEGFDRWQMPGGTANQTATGEGSVDFTLTAENRSFSGVSDAVEASGKIAVSFTINNGKGMESVTDGGKAVLSGITATLKADGGAAIIPDSDIQITITDVPSEHYAEACLLSDGADAIASILPTEAGTYQLTIAVLGSNPDYTGVSMWQFTIASPAVSDANTDSL